MLSMVHRHTTQRLSQLFSILTGCKCDFYITSWGTIGHLRWGRRRKKKKEEEIRSLEASLHCCKSTFHISVQYRHRNNDFYITWFPIRCGHKGAGSNPDPDHLLHVSLMECIRLNGLVYHIIPLLVCFLLIMNLLALT